MVMDTGRASQAFWQVEAQANQNDAFHEARAKNSEIVDGAVRDHQNRLKIQNREAEAQASAEIARRAQGAAGAAEARAAAAEAEAQKYRELLAKPLLELLKDGDDYKKAYEIQKKILEDWMVSQAAFQQLARKLRIELGKTPEQIQPEYERLELEARERLEKTGKAGMTES